MRSLECRVTRQEIDELELDQRPTEAASVHLSTCESCREFRAERADLRELVGSLETVVAPPDFDMRLRARIANEASSNRQQPFFARLFTTPALAAAALFVVVAGTAVWVAQKNTEPSATVSTEQQAKQPSATAPDAGNETGERTAVASDETETKSDSDQLAANVPARRNRPSARGPRSQDYSVLPAASVRQSTTDQAFVNAPSKPVVFALQDERGTTRKISLPPVSFGGAQTLVDNRVPVNYTGNSRIW